MGILRDKAEKAIQSPSTYQRVAHFFRKFIYPRNFAVEFEDDETGEVADLSFKALDKGEMRGRFVGPCEERIVVSHDEFKDKFKKLGNRKGKKSRKSGILRLNSP